MISSQNLRVSWKPVNPQECVWKNLYEISRGPYRRKRRQFTATSQFGSQIYSHASSNEDTRSKSSSGKRKGETWKDSSVGPDKSQSQIRGDRWSKDEGRKSSFRLTDGHLSFEECWIGGKAPKIQRSSCIPRRYCKSWFWIKCSINWTRIISISNDSGKSHGYHLQPAGLRRTSSGRSICWNQGQDRKCYKITENSKIGVSRHLDSSTTTQNGPNHGPVWKIQSFLLSEICMVILWQDCYGKGNLRKSF